MLTERLRRPPPALLVGLGVAMSLLIAAEGIGHWLNNRGIGAVLEALGSQDFDFLGKSAQRDLEIGNFAAAEQKARHAVAEIPLHQKALRILGMAQLGQHRPEGNEAIRTAGLLGWRDVPTQTWLMVDNLQRGDAQNAMFRADALARRSGMRSELFAMMVLFASQPDTRPLLMERLKLNPLWRSDFFRLARLATPDQATTLDRLLRELQKTDVPPTRVEVAPVVRRLADLQAFAQADALATDMLGAGTGNRQNAVWDGGFEAGEAYEDPEYVRTPFDWELGSAPGVTVFVDREEGDDDALYVRTSGSRDAVLARQTMRIPAGNHVFRFTIRVDQANALERFRWRINCVPGGVELVSETVLPLAANEAKVIEMPVAVPATMCDAQTLRLETESYTPRETASARFDDVAILSRP